jgi:hypothetical protein
MVELMVRKVAKRIVWWSSLGSGVALVVLALMAAVGLMWFAANASRVRPLDLTAYAPNVAEALQKRGLTVEIGGIEAFYDEAPVLRLSDIAIRGPNGDLAAFVEQAAVKLSLTGLWRLGISPKSIEARGVTLRLVRQANHAGGAAGEGEVRIAGFPPEAGAGKADKTDESGVVAWLQGLNSNATWWRLKTVKMERLNLLLRDEVQGSEWVLEDAKLQLTRYADVGEEATGLGTLRRVYGTGVSPYGNIPMLVQAKRGLDDDEVHMRARLEGLDTAMLNDYLPSKLQNLLVAQGEFALGASLGPSNRLGQPWVDLSLRNVRVNPPKGFSAPLQFPIMSLRGSYLPSPTDRLSISNLTATDSRGSVWQGAMTVQNLQNPDVSPTINALLTSPKGDVQGVFDFFPDQERGFRKTLPWLRENLISTTYTSLTARWEANLVDYPHCGTRCGLTIQANVAGGAVKFLPELPAATDITSGTFTWQGQDFWVRLPKAEVGGQQASAIEVHFTDIFSPSPTRMLVTAQLSGTVPALLKDLSGLPEITVPASISGTYAGQLMVGLPFYANRESKFSDAALTVSSSIRNFALGRVQGLPAAVVLTAPVARFGIASGTLMLNASASLAGLPLQVAWMQPLKQEGVSGSLPLMQLALQGRVPGPLLQDVLEIPRTSATLTGVVQVAANLRELAPKAWAFGATANLADAGLQVPMVALNKPRGEALSVTVQGTSGWWATSGRQGAPLAGAFTLGTLRANGRNVQVSGSLGWHPTQLAASQMMVRIGQLGATREMDVRLQPGGDVSLSGQTLDLTGMDLFQPTSPTVVAAGLKTKAPDVALKLDVARVLLARGTLLNVRGQLKRTQNVWDPTTLSANILNGSRIRLSQNGPPRRQVLNVQIDDLGQTLRVLGAYENLQGGKLAGSITYTGPRTGQGRLTMTNFELRRMPTLMRLLSLVSLEQLVAGTDTLIFNKAIFPVRQEGPNIVLKNATMEGPSMSLKLTGSYNQAQSTLNMAGQLAPAIPFNRLLTKIPLLGTLLSGSQDGLVVADFTLTGPSANPDISVQPLSLVTPGLIKDLFGGLTEPD